MLKHVNIKIYGRVQGVAFRYFAKEIAEKLKIKGFVQNLPDGSVYIEAEGKESNLKKLLDWCQIGPSLSQVGKIEVVPDKIKGFTEFLIL